MASSLTNIDDRYLDVDFATESLTSGRVLGLSAPRDVRSEPYGSIAPMFGDELIPESEWDAECDRLDADNAWCSELITRVYDQDGEPSCVSNAFCQSWEIKCAETLGRDKVVHLSQISLYKRVGSRNSGSTLSDNLREFTGVGVLPLDNAENKARFTHTFPGNGYGTSYPTGWQTTADLLKQHEYVDIPNYESFITSLLKGRPVIYARSSHCILAVKIFGRGGSRKIGYCNSWGDWGGVLNAQFEYGMGYDSESTVRRVADGSYSLRSIVVPQMLVA